MRAPNKNREQEPEHEPGNTGAATAPPDAEARALVDAWWTERRDAGNPVGQKYMAVVKVVHGMLKQGVPAHRVAFALRAAPTVSAAALEMAIQKELERRGDRAAPPASSARERRLVANGTAARFAEALGYDQAPLALEEGDTDART